MSDFYSRGHSKGRLLSWEKDGKKVGYRPQGFIRRSEATRKVIDRIQQKPAVFSRQRKSTPRKNRVPGSRASGSPGRGAWFTSLFGNPSRPAPSQPSSQEPKAFPQFVSPFVSPGKKPEEKFRPAKPVRPAVKRTRPGSLFKTLKKFPLLKKRGEHSFPFLPLVGFPILLLVSMAALTWERGEAPLWFPGAQSLVNPASDEGSRYDLALYAGLQSPVQEAPPVDPMPLDLVETFEWRSYKVKKGDTVDKIAGEYSLSRDAIIASNGIANARLLLEGAILRIPNIDGIPYTIQGGDTLAIIAKNFGIPLEVILDANDLQSDVIIPGTVIFLPGARMQKEDLKLALGELFTYPLKNFRTTSPFGWRIDPISGVRRYHAALDMAAPTGTPVMAAMDGTVSATGYNSTYGNYIIMKHSNNYQSLYAHLNTLGVKKGEFAAQGKKIGEVGSTGYSTGPHLHFQVFKNSQPINPLEVLK